MENVLCHPLQTKALASARIKTGRLDSEILAQLLRMDFIPRSFRPDQRTRSLREMVRHRAFPVRERARAKNSVHALLSSLNIKHSFGDLFSLTGREFFEKLKLPEEKRFAREGKLRISDALWKEMESTDELLKERYRSLEEARLLSPLPGVGVTLSLPILSETWEREGFGSAKKLASQAGLVPSVRQSGNAERHGRITRQGSRWLRWALVEAAIHAVGKPGPLREHYLRIKKRKGAKVARVAVARKMATYIYHMLKERKTYQELMACRLMEESDLG